MSTLSRSSASEYICNSEVTKPISLDNDSSLAQVSQNLSYAHVTQNVFFPKMDHSVILDGIDEISIKDYIFVIGDIVNPRNIRFASRISNNRICLYLADRHIAESLTTTKTVVNIKGHELHIRPLITESKRIILSNVCPIISHEVIVEKLKSFSINCTSAVSFVKAGISEPGYSHILSFRRQVFILPDDVSKLPEHMQINYDNTNYWIYISTDKPACFLCKKEGHIAKFCPQIIPHESEELTLTLSAIVDDIESKAPNTESAMKVQTSSEKVNLKRALDRSNSSASTNTSVTTHTPNIQNPDLGACAPTSDVPSSSVLPKGQIKPTKKKRKQDLSNKSTDLKTLKAMLTPVKSNLQEHPDTYILPYEKLEEFLFNAALWSSWGIHRRGSWTKRIVSATHANYIIIGYT